MSQFSPTASTETVTTGQAARILGCSLRSIQLWCNDGILRFTLTPGGHRRIKRDDLASVAHRAGKGLVLRPIEPEQIIGIQNRLRLSGPLLVEIVAIVRAVEEEIAIQNNLEFSHAA